MDDGSQYVHGYLHRYIPTSLSPRLLLHEARLFRVSDQTDIYDLTFFMSGQVVGYIVHICRDVGFVTDFRFVISDGVFPTLFRHHVCM
jgi:hypothetical protein